MCDFYIFGIIVRSVDVIVVIIIIVCVWCFKVVFDVYGEYGVRARVFGVYFVRSYAAFGGVFVYVI